jgi:arginyl-tRNA synthetase
MVSFTGQTGPYLQYTSVRMASIFADAKDFAYDLDIDRSLFEKNHYHDILKLASQYEKTLKTAAKEHAPSVLAKYLLQLASLFNHFYGEEKILVSDKKERNTKLHVLSIVKRILDDGITLLGMEVIEKM